MKIALYFLAIFSLSQAAALVRWAAAPADVIGFWRLMAASLLLLPLVGGSGLRKLWAKRAEILPPTLLSSIFLFAHLWTYVYAAQNTRIAHCLILFSTNPLFTALGNRIFFHGRMTSRMIFSYSLALTGIFFLVRHSINFESGLVQGDVSALISAFFFSGYLLSGKKALRKTSNTTYSAVLYFFAALCFGASGLIREVDFLHWPTRTWVAIAGTVALPTLLGHSLFSWLMTEMDLNLMSCGKLLEPVMAALVASLVFNEALTRESLIAFSLTAIAILILFAPWHSLRKLHRKH